MKLLSNVFLILCLSLQLHAQNSNGKVIDNESLIEISNVEIKNHNNTSSFLTNAEGSFYISKSGTYTFTKIGYVSKTQYISSDSYTIIKLSLIPENLNEIVITFNNFQSKLNSIPSSVSILNSNVIQSQNEINIAPVLNTIPGVYMHNGTLTTNRITIRGLGSRNLFGTSKIRAYYEDIPLTNGSGASTIEDIEMRAIGRIDVLKGPSSSTHGAGLGGTIQLIPYKGLHKKTSLTSSFMLGDFGLQKYMLQGDFGDSNNRGAITYSKLHSDGYRNNNETNRETVSLVSNHYLGESDKLIVIGNYINLKAFIPSSINKDDYLNNPTSGAFTWSRSKGYENYEKAFFGLSWQHSYTSKTKQFTSVFSSLLDSYEARPFNILEEKTYGFGVRSRVTTSTSLFNKTLFWSIGGEIFKDSNAYQTYNNLYQNFPPEVGSVKGDRLSNFNEKRQYSNLFFDSKLNISEKSIFSFGINLNSTSYILEDKYNTDIESLSGKYSFNSILSPKIGITHSISKNNMIYATIGHGFSPPSLEETLLPDGLINTNIKPESGWNFEIGTRGNLPNKNLQFDIAFYRMNVKNLLVSRRTGNDQYIGVNAGKTTYNGLEIAVNHHLIKNENFKIYQTNSFTYNDFKFGNFIDDSNDYSGNDLTGVPKLTINSNLNFDTQFGLYAFLNYNYVGKIPLRDDNSIYSSNYQLVNTKIGYKSNPNRKLQFETFLGVNNIFNIKYASMVLINAGSFGGNAPRYYYPGEPSNYYTGLSLKYVF